MEKNGAGNTVGKGDDTDKGGIGDDRSGRLTNFALNALKILATWPAVVILFIFIYNKDLINILKSGLEVGPVKIGRNLNELGDQLRAQLKSEHEKLDDLSKNFDDFRKQVLSSSISTGDTQEAKNINDKLDQLSTNVNSTINTFGKIDEHLNQDIGALLKQSEAKQDSTDKSKAKEWEVNGFKYIVDKDVDEAIKAFTEAEKIWPDYHNVSEIKSLLTREKDGLGRNQKDAWLKIYAKMLAQYSWGMPAYVRNSLRSEMKPKN